MFLRESECFSPMKTWYSSLMEAKMRREATSLKTPTAHTQLEWRVEQNYKFAIKNYYSFLYFVSNMKYFKAQSKSF